MHDSHLLHAAMEVAESMNKSVESSMPDELASIVKMHSRLAVGSAFIPVPGGDMAAAAANIWTMYVRINSELGLPFSDNVVKSLATGVVTNIGGAVAGTLVVGSALKFIPGLGSLGGAAVMGTTVYAITLASGVVYMKAISALLNSSGSTDISEEDLKDETSKILGNKDAIAEMIKQGKFDYKDDDD